MKPALPVRILGTASLLPGPPIPTADLVRAAQPGRDPSDVERRTGIHTRHFAGAAATTASLGAEVLGRALAEAGLDGRALRRLILVTSTGGDRRIPATAHEVVAALGLGGRCDALDLNNACLGFLSAFDLAARSAATGLGPVAVVVVETLSRHAAPGSPRPYLVLGDAAAAVLLGSAPERDRDGQRDGDGEGVVAVHFASRADLSSGVSMAHRGEGGGTPRVEFGESSEEMTAAAIRCLRESTAAVLAAAGVGLADVAWFLPHQPNGRMLERILEALEVAPERAVPVAADIGSVGAAAIAVSLDRLRRTRRVAPGDRILMAGVGAGTAHGAILYRTAT